MVDDDPGLLDQWVQFYGLREQPRGSWSLLKIERATRVRPGAWTSLAIKQGTGQVKPCCGRW